MENNELGNLQQILEDDIRSKTEIEWMYGFGKLVRFLKYHNCADNPEDTKDILFELLWHLYISMHDDKKSDFEIFKSLRTGYKKLDLHQGDKSITAHLKKLLGDIPFELNLKENKIVDAPLVNAFVFILGLCTVYPAALNMICFFDEKPTDELIKFKHYYCNEIYPITGMELNPILREGVTYY
jgi:hypothetical protein